jgi:hypothetical protein
VLAASCSQNSAPQERVQEEFGDTTYDHTHWRIDRGQLVDASYPVEEDGLVIRVPARATGGRPAAFKARFGISGDFVIRLEYSVRSLPAPDESSMNLDIWLKGPAGESAFRRTNDAKRGAGFGIRHTPTDADRATWRFSPLAAGGESRSEMIVKRRGREVQFLARESLDQTTREIGAIQFPSHIDEIWIRVVGKQVSEPVDVCLHSVEVAADRISMEERVLQRPSRHRHWLWLIPVVVVAALLFLRYRDRIGI